MATDLRLEFINAVAVGADWCIYKRRGTRLRILAVEDYLGGCFSGAEEPVSKGREQDKSGQVTATNDQRLVLNNMELTPSLDGGWSHTLARSGPLTFRSRFLKLRLYSGNQLLAARQVQLVPRPARAFQLVALAIAAPAVAWLAWLLTSLPSGESASVLQAISLVVGTGISGWMLSLRGLVVSPKSPPAFWLGLPLVALVALLLLRHFTLVVANATPSELTVPSDGNNVVIPAASERLLLRPALHFETEKPQAYCVEPSGKVLPGLANLGARLGLNRLTPMARCGPQNPVVPKALFAWLKRKTVSCLRLRVFDSDSARDARCTTPEQQQDDAPMDVPLKRFSFSSAEAGVPPLAAAGALLLRPTTLGDNHQVIKIVAFNDTEVVSMESAGHWGHSRFVVPRTRVGSRALVPSDQEKDSVAFHVGLGTSGVEGSPLGDLSCLAARLPEPHVGSPLLNVWLRPSSAQLQRVAVMKGTAVLSEWTVLARERLAPAVFCSDRTSHDLSSGEVSIQIEMAASFSHSQNLILKLPNAVGPVQRVHIFVGGEWHGDIELGPTDVLQGLQAADLSLRTIRVSGLKDDLSELSLNELPVTQQVVGEQSAAESLTGCNSAIAPRMTSVWKAEKNAPSNWAWALLPPICAPQQTSNTSGNPSPEGAKPFSVWARDRSGQSYTPVVPTAEHASDATNRRQPAVPNLVSALQGQIRFKPKSGRHCLISHGGDIEVTGGNCARQNPQMQSDVEWILEHGRRWAAAGCDLSQLEICK